MHDAKLQVVLNNGINFRGCSTEGNMLKEEVFCYNGVNSPKGTVIWYKKGSEIRKYIFVWRYIEGGRFLVITDGSSGLPGHLPRAALLPNQFFDSIVRVEQPSASSLQKVRELETDFARQNPKRNDNSWMFIFAITVATMLFPPIGIALLFYVFTRKK